MQEVLNLKDDIDFTKEPIFLGNNLNIQRYDQYKIKKFFDLFKEQLSFFWRPEEVSLQKDINDYQLLTDHEKFIFTKNLLYQTMLDSVQARAIPFLAKYTSLPEFEASCSAWQFFEQIHSYSYTYIIKNVYPNPKEIFDSVLKDQEIVKRATSVTKHYNDLIQSIHENSLENIKRKIFLTLVSVNILEGIRFYVSFACSYCFAQNKLMEGNAKIISLINRDENLHLALTQNTLKILKTEKSEGFVEIAKELEPLVIQMYEDAAQEEIQWANYLFSKGSMLGLNSHILELYMKYLTNKRMAAIGYKPLFKNIENPIHWIDSWIKGKNVQTAPQETELESYKITSIKNDVENIKYEII
ncbi:MAG: ribonucleotide-diphosphate reductase subunit beta [Candidatus Dojkabacteria bacterium]|nr:ribonucleotide-diphosphate reductase subunit beta [Candidatus Dojkabacteria bacterium]